MIKKMQDSDYFAIDAVSNSLLSRYAKCPAACNLQIEPTPAMALGTLAHALILEGFEVFHSRFAAIGPCDRRTKEGKAYYAEFCAENAGKTVITLEQLNTVSGMAESVMSHPTAVDLLSEGEPEMAITWTDKETGLACKSKADWLRPDFLIDLKTTQSADEWVFQRTIWNMGYAKQFGMYHDGLMNNLMIVPNCVIIAVESVEPFCCNTFRISEEMLEAGKGQYKSLLREYAIKKKANFFPSYQHAGMIDVQLPAYAR